MQPFHQLTNEEILTLDNNQLTDAIRVGALDRGIEIPITLPEALRTSEWRGYQQPTSAVKVYCPFAGSYSEPTCGYLSQAEAESAMNGLVMLGTAYRNGKSVPCINSQTSPTIKIVTIGESPNASKSSAFQTAMEAPCEEFEKYRDECLEKSQAVRQSDYDRKVRAEHRKEYLRLAEGNEEIAKAFYARQGRGAWPNEDGSIT